MKWIRFLALGAIVTSTGCNKLMKPLLIGPIQGTPLKNQIILVIGQSNNARWEQYGEQAFVQDYAKQSPGTLQFINCAVGGTSINQWAVDGQLMNQCNTHHLNPTAIFFYQGEADAQLNTQNWAQQFTSNVNGWRNVFGNIPVIYAQIAVEDPTLYCPLSQWKSIQQQQTEVSIPNVKMIQTQDISQLDPDPALAQGVHLNPQSYVNISQRYVNALLGEGD